MRQFHSEIVVNSHPRGRGDDVAYIFSYEFVKLYRSRSSVRPVPHIDREEYKDDGTVMIIVIQ